MSEKQTQNPQVNEEINTSNIFDEFSMDTKLNEEVKKLKEEEKKDIYYYLSSASSIFKKLFFVLLITIILLVAYIFIQKNEKIVNSALIDPICIILQPSGVSLPEENSYCSSISSTKNIYEQKLVAVKQKQLEQILLNLVKFYENDNVLKSKDVAFLIDKTENRPEIVENLKKFDKLKKDFTGIEKTRIQCEEINFNSVKNILEVKCSAHSNNYEENSIIGFSGDEKKQEEFIGGTSVSLANSFLNYIEKNTSDFILVERQKLFDTETITGDSEIGRTTSYTKKTDFTIKLKIN